MILKILTTPNKQLEQRAETIKKIDRKIISLAQNMLETNQANFGLGLAGPQVGVSKRIIVAEKMVLINPKITESSKEKEYMEESCLSLPGLSGMVPRAKEITVSAIKLTAGAKFKPQKTTFSASGLLARVLQHEIDHLDGILFTERVEDITSIKSVPVPYKIVFLGTSEFAVPILEGLIKNKWGISCVITEPDKPAGRRQILTPSPIKQVTLKHGLLVYQPEKISNIKSQLSNLKPDLIILAAYGQIIPSEILDIPTYGSLCIHPSLLPKYRGPSPIQCTILNGEKETGVTIFKMDEKIDHGPAIKNKRLKIKDKRYNSLELSKELANLAADLLLKTLPLYLEGKIKPRPQNHKKATYTKLLKKEDGQIENSKLKTQNSKELEEIERKIRAYYPWPKVWTFVNGKRIIIHKAHIEKEKLILDVVQPEGKKAMKYEEYLKGNPKIV